MRARLDVGPCARSPTPLVTSLQRLRAAAPVTAATQTTVIDWTVPAVSPRDSRSRAAVDDSPELHRILKLARRPPIDVDDPNNAMVQALVGLMTERLGFRNDNCQCKQLDNPCIRELKPTQAWALYEAPIAGGLLGPIGVGHGKTGLDLLMPMVMPDCKLAVLLLPPGLQDQLLTHYRLWSQHFRVPSLVLNGRGYIIPGRPVLHVVPYSLFSREQSTTLLEQMQPDLLIADEGQKLRQRDTATTSRVLRYFLGHADTRLCVWSGTLTARSLRDYAHLAAYALGEGSPLPLMPPVVDEWSTAIDPIERQAPPGALRSLCNSPVETLEAAFERRLADTLGVVKTKGSAIGASLIISERKAPDMPDSLAAMLGVLREDWIRPDGEEFVDILRVAGCARELASGFYYKWFYPKGEPAELIERWFKARKAWHHELRIKLQAREPHLDSELLCTKAVMRAYQSPPYEGDLPVWRAEKWPEWRDVRKLVEPESRAVWVSDYLAADAAEWGLKNKGIIWYEHDAFGRKVAALSGLPLHEGGPDAGKLIAKERGDRSIIASIHSHGTGRDGLQKYFRTQLVANPPASGDKWEQLLGRLHRIGQLAEDVAAELYLHTDEMADAFYKARREAKYIQGTMGTAQKLLTADITFPLW